MIREKQVLELNIRTEEKVKPDTKTEELSRNQGSKASQKYKTVFNCSYSEGQE
jgi:hypothetical protein